MFTAVMSSCGLNSGSPLNVIVPGCSTVNVRCTIPRFNTYEPRAAQVDVGFRGLEPRVGAQINRHVIEIEAGDQFWRAIWQQTSIYEERRINQVIELRIVEIHDLFLVEIREKDAALIEYDRPRQHRGLLRTPQTKRIDGPDTGFGRHGEIGETEP